jgi:hypothetical protein
MKRSLITFRFEQAVYGSFAFWNRGYAVLARSAGCRPEWLAELRTVCQRYGEPPSGAAEANSLFALRLKSGPWMIVGVHPQGHDDQDRPGALAFHALFVGRWVYRWTGADPFAMAGALQREWSPADQERILPEGRWRLPQFDRASSLSSHTDERLAPIVAALTQRRRVAVQSIEPIDGLARDVWRALPSRVRRRVSVATWAFDNANHFDLVALPKLSGVALGPSDLILRHEGWRIEATPGMLEYDITRI